MFSIASATRNNANNAQNGQFQPSQPHYEDQHDDLLEEEGRGADVPLYEGELRPEWRYTCPLCYAPSGLAPKYCQSLSKFIMHNIEEHADGESLDLIARVTLAQYPPLTCGPTKANRGATRGSSVHGGSVQGSVHAGSVQGSVRGGSIQGSLQGSHHGSHRGSHHGSVRIPATRTTNYARGTAPGARQFTQPAAPAPPVAPAPALSTAQIYQQMMAQNQALMAQMQALGLENLFDNTANTEL